MDCSAFCTASSYRIRPLGEALRHHYQVTFYRDVLHVSYPLQNQIVDIFCFPYGAFVCWGASLEEARKFCSELKPFEEQPLEEVEKDIFTYTYGDVPKVKNNDITLPDNAVITKLAVSYGIAQSVKLSSFEVAIHKSYNLTKHIPEELAREGKISLSRRAIRRKMGDLFLERSSINLHLDVLDSPDFFWEYPELEPLYVQVAADEELGKRLEVLNQRLVIVHELFEVLGNELNHQHSSRLEWTIIWLIIIEVVLTLLRDVFQVLR